MRAAPIRIRRAVRGWSIGRGQHHEEREAAGPRPDLRELAVAVEEHADAYGVDVHGSEGRQVSQQGVEDLALDR
jgi:hypothetical protein